MLTKEQRDYLLPHAYNAALRAGAAILKVYLNQDYHISIKSDNTPITIADRDAHSVICEYLSPTHVPVLSEEGREMIYEERRGWDLFWMVDPLDGTKEFIKGNGEFTVNIALMSNHRPVMSVLYVPYIGRMFFADRELGSFLQEGVAPDENADVPLSEILSNAIQLPVIKSQNSPIVIAISRSNNTEETYRYLDILKLLYPDAKVIKQGSSYKFCLLAEGSVDAYVRTTNTYEWDTAAGELILEVAGGRTRSLPGNDPLEYNKITLLNPYFLSLGPNVSINMEQELLKRDLAGSTKL